jgi:2-amino-4-hydroxy-6-hydroxymethyldihydropteridine diphosphokinase
MTQVYIGLGSNLAPRERFLEQARDKLRSLKADDFWQESSVVETEPWGVLEQPKFLNQVVSFRTELNPQELLAFCKQTECELGRRERPRWHEREIDLDILYYGELVLQTEALTIPHPRIEEREFVRVGLRELAVKNGVGQILIGPEP